MATTGSVDINLTVFGNTINNVTSIAEEVTGGVADQGALIGLAIGLTLAIGLLFVLIFSILAIIPRLIGKVKGMQGA